MNIYEIPLQPSAQTLRIRLSGVYYNLTILWNNFNNTWTLDIADDAGNGILSGIPLVVGVNLLQQYDYLNFGGMLVANVDVTGFTDNSTNPTYENLGIDGHLYFVTTP